MAQNRKNDGFDLGELDDLLGAERSEPSNGAEGFDIFNFSSADLEAVSAVGRVQDDLDLDSFLNFDDLTEPEPEPEPEPEEAAPAAQPEPEESEEEDERQSRRRERRARKEAAFAELFGEPEAPEEPESDEPEYEAEPQDELVKPKAKRRGLFARRREAEAEWQEDDREEPEVTPEPEPAPEPEIAPEPETAPEPEVAPEPEITLEPEVTEEPETEPVDEPDEEEYTPRKGFFARLIRPREDVDDDLDDEPDDDLDDEPDEEEYAPRKGFFARLIKPREDEDDDLDDEPDDDLADDEPEEDPAPRKGFFARFMKPYEPEEEEDDDAADEADTAPETDEKPAGEKISFFARLTPEKEKFQALMQAKKEEEHRPRRRADMVAADNASLAETVDHEPRRGEMLVYDSELDEISYIDRDDLPESRDYLPVRFRRYGRSGIGGGLMYALFVISVSVILACFGWLCAADVLALSKDEVTSVVVVESYVPQDTDTLNEDGEPVDERGDVITCDIDQVATALKEGEIINFKFLFKLFAKLSHASAKIDPGTYDVSTKLDYRALITEMQTGSDSQEITKITFPEGYRMEQIFELLEDNDICDYDDLMDAAANHDYSYSWLDEEWYYEAEGDPTRLEGYLFPDTYEFYQGENAINVINRFLLRFHGLLTQDMYQQADNLGISLHEAVIVASLIEKEAGANDDRSNFSSVIYNRLNSGWKLQLDSTINYIQNTSTFNISYADLETDSPYNTYLYEGLPKGAICNAGLASLNAALNPNSTNYWFWYAYDGSTYFFTNSSDFDNFAYEHPYD